jgi:hypothetical protein
MKEKTHSKRRKIKNSGKERNGITTRKLRAMQ